MSKIRERLNSDKAAVGSVETILLIVLAVFAVLAIYNLIMKPLMTSAENIGGAIKDMDPGPTTP